MATCGHKKEDLEHTSIIDTPGNKAARPAKPWNPFGQLPAPQRGGDGDGEEDEKITAMREQLVQPGWIQQHHIVIVYTFGHLKRRFFRPYFFLS